jgi:cysteine desulfurase / selenocysteine lyase
MASNDLLPGADLPPGLPDPALLARLAGEFFAALPGLPTAPAAVSSVVPAHPQPAGLSVPPGAVGPATPTAVPGGALPPGANLVPQSPQSAASFGGSAPARLPNAQAPNGVPDHVLTAAPGYDGRWGSYALGVPVLPGAGDFQLTHADELVAQSFGLPSFGLPFGLPSASTLRELLTGSSPTLPTALPGALPSAPQNAQVGAKPGAASSHQPPHLPLHASPTAHSPTGFYFLEAAQPTVVPQASRSAHPPFDVHAVRRDFPILQERVNGRPLVWFDNAATTQKPQCVIDRLAHFYAHENSNIHRAAHELAARATDAYEKSRETVRRFIGASSTEEIVFVRGTTEAINLVAKSWGAKHIGPGDEIIVSHLEHHANIVPWQQLASEKGAKVRVIPVDDSGQVLLEEYQRLLNDKTKIVAVTQVSNALGTVVPVKEIVALAHRAGALALVDGAQSVSHMRVDVQALDADFFVFSGHKIFGPTGIGVVYGKRAVLENMPPWQGGGNMIADVTFERTIYHAPPTRFEAGTGNIADAVGLGAALEYVECIGIENIGHYEHALLAYATQHMAPIPGVRLVGTAPDKASVLSFVLAGYSTDEVGKALNQEGIAVRTGHHCAQPILRRFGLETSVRPSLAFYNTCEEVDRMVAVIKRLVGSRRM